MKDCQKKHWKDVHKRICNHSQTLLRLACLPRQPYIGRYLDFKDKNDVLLPYKYINKKNKLNKQYN